MLTVTGLTVSRGERVLFRDLSFSLASGEALALTGANGAGKTSLLRVAAGFLRPDAGRIDFAGADPHAARASALHWLGHLDGLKGARRAREELAFQARWFGADADGIAAAVEVLALALSSILSLERLFERDHEDGALDLIALGPAPLELVVVAKAKAQWLAVGWPLAITAPVAGITLGLPADQAPLVAVSALIGGLGFALTGALGAALALGSRRGGMLIAVVVLPLFIPPVVFGAGALERAVNGLSPAPALAFLFAYVLFAAIITPFAGAAAIRNAQG